MILEFGQRDGSLKLHDEALRANERAERFDDRVIQGIEFAGSEAIPESASGIALNEGILMMHQLVELRYGCSIEVKVCWECRHGVLSGAGRGLREPLEAVNP